MTFSHVTSIEPLGDGRFSATVDPRWALGGRANGGYLLAMLGRATAAIATQDHVIAMSAVFVRSPGPGSAVIDIEVMRAGRNTSQARARLSQDDGPCVEALVTLSTLASTQAYWTDGLPDPGATPFHEAFRLENSYPGMDIPIFDQLDLRLDPASLGFGVGAPSGAGELRGWLALPDGEPFDPCSLLFAVDAFPPATLDIERSGWVPTLELTAYVRALPAPGPVRVLQKARLIDDGRVDEACFVWDSTGRLVAQGTQLAGIRLG